MRRMISKVSACKSSLLVLRKRLSKGSERPVSRTNAAWDVARTFASLDVTRLAQSRTELLVLADPVIGRTTMNVQTNKCRMIAVRLTMCTKQTQIGSADF